MVKYQLQVYFRGSSFVMPFVVIAAFLYTMYSIKPLDVVSGILTSSIFIFVFMVWIGLSTSQKDDDVVEGILFLRMQKPGRYYLGKCMFLSCIASLVAVLCTFFPIIQSLINNNHLFVRQITFDDIINVLLLLSGCALCGGMFGSLFHPHVVKDRKVAIAQTVLFSILTISSPAITNQYPTSKYILWVLPPIMMPWQVYTNEPFFDLAKTLRMFALLCVYSFAYGLIKSYLCYRRRF